jgi:hypothetical protein
LRQTCGMGTKTTPDCDWVVGSLAPVNGGWRRGVHSIDLRMATADSPLEGTSRNGGFRSIKPVDGAPNLELELVVFSCDRPCVWVAIPVNGVLIVKLLDTIRIDR